MFLVGVPWRGGFEAVGGTTNRGTIGVTLGVFQQEHTKEITPKALWSRSCPTCWMRSRRRGCST